MIRVTLRNGSVLLFHEHERLATVNWISDDGDYWSGECIRRADELLRVVETYPNQDRYVIERIRHRRRCDCREGLDKSDCEREENYPG